MLFSAKGSPQFLIAGLGNPGPKYENTRHNAGFLCIDVLAREHSVSVDTLKHKALVTRCSVGDVPCILAKPQTFMNLSGESIGALARFYKIPPERIVILCDDVNFAPGTLRIRKKGSDGGQKGLRSIIEHLSSEDFVRLRLGVGVKPHPQMDLADWVLSKFSDADRKGLDAAMQNAVKAVQLIVKGETDLAMSRYNGNALS